MSEQTEQYIQTKKIYKEKTLGVIMQTTEDKQAIHPRSNSKARVVCIFS